MFFFFFLLPARSNEKRTPRINVKITSAALWAVGNYYSQCTICIVWKYRNLSSTSSTRLTTGRTRGPGAKEGHASPLHPLRETIKSASIRFSRLWSFVRMSRIMSFTVSGIRLSRCLVKLHWKSGVSAWYRGIFFFLSFLRNRYFWEKRLRKRL